MKSRLVIALASIGLSAGLYAGQPGNQVIGPTGLNLVAPDTVGIWSFGLEVFHVKATNDDFQYGQVVSLNSAGDLVTHNVTTDSKFHAGATVDATYILPENGMDIKISATSIQFTDNNTTTIAGANAGEIFLPAFSSLLGLGGTESGARAKDEQHYTSGDLLFGQWIRIGHEVDLHPFVGVRYADINDKATGRYVDSATTVVQEGVIKSDFDGIGPRAGMEAAVHVGWGFSFVARLGASLLVGDLDSSVKESDPGSPLALKYNNDDATHTIPELDERLGVDYIYNFTPTASMSAQLGVENVEYFGAVSKDDLDSAVPNSVLGSSNFGYRGFYLRLQTNLA